MNKQIRKTKSRTGQSYRKISKMSRYYFMIVYITNKQKIEAFSNKK